MSGIKHSGIALSFVFLASCGASRSSAAVAYGATAVASQTAANASEQSSGARGTMGASGSGSDCVEPADSIYGDSNVSTPANGNIAAPGGNATAAADTNGAVACVFHQPCTVLGQQSLFLINQAGVILTTSAEVTDSNTSTLVQAALVRDRDQNITSRASGLLNAQGLRVVFPPQLPLLDANNALSDTYTLYAWTANGDVLSQALGAFIARGDDQSVLSWQFIPNTLQGGLGALAIVADMARMQAKPAILPNGLTTVRTKADSFGITLCVLSGAETNPGSSGQGLSAQSMLISDNATGVTVFNDTAYATWIENGVCLDTLYTGAVLPAGASYTVRVLSTSGTNAFNSSGGQVIQSFIPIVVGPLQGETTIYSGLGAGAVFAAP